MHSIIPYMALAAALPRGIMAGSGFYGWVVSTWSEMDCAGSALDIFTVPNTPSVGTCPTSATQCIAYGGTSFSAAIDGNGDTGNTNDNTLFFETHQSSDCSDEVGTSYSITGTGNCVNTVEAPYALVFNGLCGSPTQ